MSQVSPWDGPPSEDPWLRTGRNSRASHNKLKAEIHIPWAECGLSQKARVAPAEARSTYRVWAISKGESG